MDEQIKLKLPLPIPRTQNNGRWRLVLRVICWILIGYAGILFITTVPIAVIGGPIEPPGKMSMDEFCRWKESGAWLNEAVWMIVGCVLLIVGCKKEIDAVTHSLFTSWRRGRGRGR